MKYTNHGKSSDMSNFLTILLFLFLGVTVSAQNNPSTTENSGTAKKDKSRTEKVKKENQSEAKQAKVKKDDQLKFYISELRDYDTDKDGIKDFEDECPGDKGLKELNGCPKEDDADNDGISDLNDECPYFAGDPNHAGCPKPLDVDEDGIPDVSDECPNVPGVPENNGCPSDLDQDGIYDKDDRCPTLSGVNENFGCPEIKEEVKEQLQQIAKSIQFKTGSSMLKAESIKMLDALVPLLEKHTEWNLEIRGHTDGAGDRQKNIILSQERANAAKNYLVDQGISEERLIARGFGPDMPVATNKTEEGRTKNRRVELKVNF
jgi:outer membrane protein OmpA-like peptidoglycan-associated protein